MALLAGLAEAIAIVEVDLRYAIVVGDKQVGTTCAAQVRRRGGQRPAPAVDAELRAHFFESSIAEIVK